MSARRPAGAPARPPGAVPAALALAAAVALAAALAPALAPSPARAAGEAKHPPHRDWSFDGPFGAYDRAALQRGLQVYREVCAACHGVRRLAFRDFAALGYGPGQIRSLAAEYSVVDGPDDEGDLFERPALPSDRVPPPFASDEAARAANGGALPPDLSLIVKARAHGADYLHALLAGYPEGAEPDGVLYENPYYPGGRIAMAPPLAEGIVEYADGTAASVDQMAADVTHFLAWAAEPELEERKRAGIKTILFLAVLLVVFAVANRRVWARVR